LHKNDARTWRSGAAPFVAANPRPDAAPEVGGTLTVAGANLLNWFDTTTGCTFGVSGGRYSARSTERRARHGHQVLWGR
jgi:predicted extracellular nuclease